MDQVSVQFNVWSGYSKGVHQLTTGEAVTDNSWRIGQGQLSVEDRVLFGQHQGPVAGRELMPASPRHLREQIRSHQPSAQKLGDDVPGGV